MFEVKEPQEFICNDCESEFIVKELHTDLEVTYCPYCAAVIEVEQDED